MIFLIVLIEEVSWNYMIIGFLGKGGSGKSTLSTQFTHFLNTKGIVLAIDADHNMDLTYNLGQTEEMPYIGHGLNDVLRALKVDQHHTYRDIFDREDVSPLFHLDPVDELTTKLSVLLPSNIRLMSTGPHNEDILYGKSCSHILTTPLKVYLPLLEVHNNEFVIIDEKAGTDGAGTGVVTGFDVAVIAVEPTRYGIKAAKQIAEILDFYQTPYVFVANKVFDEDDKTLIQEDLPEVAGFVPFEKSLARTPDSLSEGLQDVLETIYAKLEEIYRKTGNTRLERTKEKFIKHKEYRQ